MGSQQAMSMNNRGAGSSTLPTPMETSGHFSSCYRRPEQQLPAHDCKYVSGRILEPRNFHPMSSSDAFRVSFESSLVAGVVIDLCDHPGPIELVNGSLHIVGHKVEDREARRLVIVLLINKRFAAAGQRHPNRSH